jgi:hypothetical protein
MTQFVSSAAAEEAGGLGRRYCFTAPAAQKVY